MERNQILMVLGALFVCLPLVACSPLPTPAPEPGKSWHGIVRSPETDWQTMRDELDASVVELLVKPTSTDAAILSSLDRAEDLGLRVLLHVYDGSTNTDVPWDWNGSDWSITQRGAEILALVEGHPAIWALYCLEEPFDYTSPGHVTADGQRAMYQFLRQYTSLPLYSDLATISRAEQEGVPLSDGMCDKCCVAPTNWGRGLRRSIRRANAEFDTWRRTMSEAELVFMVNVYGGAGHRMPTTKELAAFRDHACSLGVPIVYYPWTGYDDNLSRWQELWPVIAQSCQ